MERRTKLMIYNYDLMMTFINEDMLSKFIDYVGRDFSSEFEFEIITCDYDFYIIQCCCKSQNDKKNVLFDISDEFKCTIKGVSYCHENADYDIICINSNISLLESIKERKTVSIPFKLEVYHTMDLSHMEISTYDDLVDIKNAIENEPDAIDIDMSEYRYNIELDSDINNWK